MSLYCWLVDRHSARRIFVTFDFSIHYVPGPDNCVADALLHLPVNTQESIAEHHLQVSAAVMSVRTDDNVLDEIRAGYKTDRWCAKLLQLHHSTPGMTVNYGLIYIGGRLVIPDAGNPCERLFRLAYDMLGHFGAAKSYAVLRDA